MTDDDKALVERLRDFVIAEDIDAAADRIEAQAAEIEKLREREAELHGQLMRMIDRWEAQAARLAEADALIEKARSATVFDQSWNVDAYILVPQFDAYLEQST